jgi:hypothetical protein
MQTNATQVVFSNEERDTLIQLLDLATKSGGLQVASAALKIVAKFQPPAAPAAPAVLPDPQSRLDGN